MSRAMRAGSCSKRWTRGRTTQHPSFFPAHSVRFAASAPDLKAANDDTLHAVYPTLTISPNGALLCAFPFASSSIPSQPLIAAAPLGSSSNLEEKLATRLAIAIARMGDAGDLVGRIKGLGSAGALGCVFRLRLRNADEGLIGA